jgi:DegV family protein with EDD domain
MVKIIVDSTCDLPEEFTKKYDIKSLPLKVYLGGKEYLDKVTIKVDEVYDAMRKGIMPKTSQPSPMDIYNLFQDYCKQGYNFIYLAFSSAMSSTHQLATTIVNELKDKYTQNEMAVIDSKSGSTATGLIALQAAKLAEAGYGFETITRQLKQLIEHVEHVFTIADLNWIIKGGRISRSQGLLGNILNIKPILHVNNGMMEVINKVRGRKKAINTVVEILAERIRNFPDQIIGVSHADDSEIALEFVDAVERKLGKKTIMINKIGSVLGSHLGIGGVGVFFFNKKPEIYIK